jgi:S1-C subfamily serine protease
MQPAEPVVKPKTRSGVKLPKSTILLLLCFVVAFSGAWLGTVLSLRSNSTTPATRVQNDGNLVATKQEVDMTALTEKVSPSVVSIITSGASMSAGGMYEAAGTGMVVSKNGYVLTNKHVVSGARSATVIMSDGSTHKNVPIVGTDPLNDIAFLKIPDVNDLKAIELGDSKTVRVGQQVVAIGNALGQYDNSVTSGIVSGLGRPVQAGDESGRNVETLSDLLQTDAAINSGNSGGPLLNMQGQVIGINTAVAADAQNIGFAIPIGSVKGALAGLIESGTVARAIMGVQYLTITPEVKAEYNLPVTRGDYVYAAAGSAIKAGGPADQAGIKDKDILLKVNGEQISAGKSVATLVGEYKPGDVVVITLQRDGKTQDVRVKLGKY